MSVGNGPNRIQVKRSTAALAADPSKLAALAPVGCYSFSRMARLRRSGLQRLEGVAEFWQQFVRKYLADTPVTRRAA
jgi:hypothetical protein